ncbi:glycosyltransferase [Klebsiella pneumoniae]|nr:glycosyltransferase [Klebsiella pneumoniae]
MRIVYFVNAAWYFELHWLDRSEAAISKGYEVHLVSNFADDAIKNNLEKKGIKCWDIELNRFSKEGANKQVISSQADSLIKISRIWADFFPANTSNQPI